jgi:hypothetical protein
MEKYNSDTATAQEIPVNSDSASVLRSVNWISLLVALCIVTGMIVDKQSVTVSVITGGATYGIVAVLLILWQPGALPWIIVSRMREVTIRRYNELQFDALEAQAERKQVAIVDTPRIVSTPPVAPMQLPDTPNFVSPVPPTDERIKLDAYNFVAGLFDEYGRLHPKRVLPKESKRPGQVQSPKPKSETVEYLVALGIVRVGDQRMLFYNTEHFSALRKAAIVIESGTPHWRGGDPPSNALTPPHHTRAGEVAA